MAHARAHPGAGDIAYLLGDFGAAPFRPSSVDLVTSVAALHHTDAEAALREMAAVLRPGRVLAVVGLARGVARPTPRGGVPGGIWPPAPGSGAVRLARISLRSSGRRR